MKTLFFICTVIVVISSDNALAQQKSTVIDNAKTVFFRDKHQNLSVSTDGGTTWRQLGKTDMTDEEAQQDQTNPLSIAPNPATQAAELSFMMDEKATAEISLIGLDGKAHFTTQIQCRQGKNTFRLPTQNLAAGAYYCVVHYGAILKRSLFLVQ